MMIANKMDYNDHKDLKKDFIFSIKVMIHMEDMVDLLTECDQTTLLFLQDGLVGIAQCYLDRFASYFPCDLDLSVNWEHIHDKFLPFLSRHSPFIIMYECIQHVKDLVNITRANNTATLRMFMQRYENIEYSAIRILLHEDIAHLFETLLSIYYQTELDSNMIPQLMLILDLNLEIPDNELIKKEWTNEETRLLLRDPKYLENLARFAALVFNFFANQIIYRVTTGLPKCEIIETINHGIEIVFNVKGMAEFESCRSDREIIEIIGLQVWMINNFPMMASICNFVLIRNQITNESLDFKQFLLAHQVPKLSRLITNLESDFFQIVPRIYYREFGDSIPLVLLDMLWKFVSNI